MFQNISESKEETVNEKKQRINKKQMIKNMFSISNIIIYIIAFLVSTVSFLDGMSIFGLAIFAAACSNGLQVLMIYLLTMLGTYLGFGAETVFSYFLTTLVFIVLMILVKPNILEETKNEKKLVGKHLIASVIVVQAMNIFTGTYLIGDLLQTVIEAILTYIFYKIFVNSLESFKEISFNKAFTLEEVIGASLLISIAISACHSIHIYGISVQNVLCILLLLVLGWQNGILVGAITGLSIGLVLAIVGIGSFDIIATYAISGAFAGLLNRFRKNWSNIWLFIR